MRTLAIDVGGTWIKAVVLDEAGQHLGEPIRVPMPRPATRDAVVEAIVAMAPAGFERVSVGFPGVVVDGVTRNAPNLDGGWGGFDLAGALASRLRRPVRVANDADMQALGIVEGRGTELVITLGTGMGSGLALDGRLVPNVELGHHPLRDGRTYEDLVRDSELARIGVDPWKERVREACETMLRIFNPRRLYVGGGNARHFAPGELGPRVVLVDNAAGLLGGIRLWDATP